MTLAHAIDRFAGDALVALRPRVEARGIDAEQRTAHAYAWIVTTVEAITALHRWADALHARDALTDVERAIVALGTQEGLNALIHGVAIGPNEIVRNGEWWMADAAQALASNPAVVAALAVDGQATRAELANALADGATIAEDFGDELLDGIRDTYRRFTDSDIIPHAHGWHLRNDLIPDATVAALAELGTFGVCIPEEYGGLGLGKLVMCIVSEELSRGWIGTGSLGTRSEIAGELILLGGTAQQQEHWLPRIASGEVLPTAVFTEPDVGSDLGSLTTRATRERDGWRIDGAKNWITHAARTDLMTMLVRTDAGVKGYAGLSMLLVPKPRGTEADPFPATGMTGSEIEVLGYRGMREYALQFDGMTAPADALLGGEEGQGFKQLMRTFEGARIQTAARAVGVARRALDLSLSYATTRKQFGKAIIAFPRVADKIAMMAVDMVMARELTYAAARTKDNGKRCDIEAGMAKLFAARAAWTSADAGVQVHGGNGYALDYEISRVLCDARILNIFEGAAEIQAQVIARGRLGDRN